ncbi:hypothetical protein R6Q57_004237 [Mikania cordata]
MGARKKESYHGGPNTRNLGKSQLGSVIFGAANTTINECLSKQLFGLPKEHLEYVEKIVPGLPLFLFNYTDRKLHGVFEAASHGQRDIDPYAWTCEGKQKSPFPAQVQVRVQSARQPLTENLFKPIIADNYFTRIHFCLFLLHFLQRIPLYTQKWKMGLKREKSTSFSGMTVNSDTSDDSLGTDKKDEKELVYMKLKELAANRICRDPPATHEDKAAHTSVDPHSAAHEDETSRKRGDPSSAAREDDITLGANSYSVDDPIIAQVSSIYKCHIELAGREGWAEAQNEIRYLKDQYHCIMSENMVGPYDESDTINRITSSNELHLDDSPDINFDTCDDLIFLVGGYDGISWFSSLDSYSPSNNHIKALNPMETARCYAPVSILNGQLYVFGGGTRGVWYDTGSSIGIRALGLLLSRTKSTREREISDQNRVRLCVAAFLGNN